MEVHVYALEDSYGWYCQLKIGLMTVGCYTQVAAVLRYLGKQRQQAVEVLSDTNYYEDPNCFKRFRHRLGFQKLS